MFKDELHDPYHAELNPIELIWGNLKGYYLGFGFDDGIWVLISQVPGHCSLVTCT